MAVDKLQHVHATSIRREIKTFGHSPLLVTGSDFELYVAKNDKGQKTSIHLINEIIATYFLNLWNLPTPDCRLITFDKTLIINETLSDYHKLHYYDKLSFGSKWVKNSLDLNDFSVTHDLKKFNQYLNPLEFLRIALFDEWIENDDRKPTNYNLILQPESKKYRIIPIDHAFTFSTMNYVDLDPLLYVPKGNDHLLISELGNLIKDKTLIDQQLIKTEEEYFYICLEKCEKHFNSIIDEITPYYPLSIEDVNSLRCFIFDSTRNKKVFQEHVYRLTHA